MFLSTPFDKVSTKQNYCVAMFNPYVVLYKAKQLLYHTILTLSHAEQSVVRIVNSLPLANEVCEGYVFTSICHSLHRGGLQAHAQGGGCGVWLGGLQAHIWGSPGPGGCIPACTEADTPPQQTTTAAGG